MTRPPIPPDDPRLTAYVLGELNDDERAEVERQIEASAELAAEVDEIRETVALLTAELADEPAPELTDAQREAIAAESEAVAAGVENDAAGQLQYSPLPLGEGPGVRALSDAHPNPSPGGRGAFETSSETVAAVAEQDADALESSPPRRRLRNFAITMSVLAGVLFAVVIPLLKLPNEGRQFAAHSSKPILTKHAGNGPVEKFEATLEVTSDLNESRQFSAAGTITSVVGEGSGPTAVPHRKPMQQSGGMPADVEIQVGKVDLPGIGSDLGAGEVTGEVGSSVGTVSGAFTRSKRLKDELPRAAIVNGKSIMLANDEEVDPKTGRRVIAPKSPVVGGSSAPVSELIRSREQLLKELPQALLRDSSGTSGPNAEQYLPIVENRFLSPATQPLSTFGIDVDTASYSNVRRFLTHGQWPDPDAVRIEELVNYFRYDYAPPRDGQPFAVNVEVGGCPWKPAHRLVRIALKGKEIDPGERPPSNLVFLVDVSGSMQPANKLPLVKASLELLASQMTESDRIAIVTYAGNAGLLLDSTTGDDKAAILAGIRSLNAGGSTNGEAGIRLAYETAVRHFADHGANRIILCTDGDFNVGVSDDNELVRLIQEKARSGVFLSIFGFGMGNIKDGKLEQLADKGNGHYGYIDDLREARKVFSEEMTGTLYTIAKDVKLQVEFNPLHVGAYRLIGYENRALAARDFNDDTKDAGDIGAGHCVTALYEVVPSDVMPESDIDPLKYQTPGQQLANPKRDGKLKELHKELLTVKLRYKQPDEEKSAKLELAVVDDRAAHASRTRDFNWAAAVAAFGMTLRDSQFRGDADFELVLELAMASRGEDREGHRREFIELVQKCRELHAGRNGSEAPEAPILSELEAYKRASCGGRYSRLLEMIEVPGDVRRHGTFHDDGYWRGRTYRGYADLPPGYWVYVAPNWYIWGQRND